VHVDSNRAEFLICPVTLRDCPSEGTRPNEGPLLVYSLFASFSSPNPMAASSRSLSRPSSRQDIKATKPSPTQSSKPADYVYFDRTTVGFSDDAVPRAKAAQVKLEHYYKVAVDAAIERNTRFFPLGSPSSFTLTTAFKARRAREAAANRLNDV